jgi:hypothetical protein
MMKRRSADLAATPICPQDEGALQAEFRVLQRDICACCAHVFEFALQMQPQAQIAAMPH